MFRKVFLFGGLLLLAGAAVLMTPGFGQAQHHGGGFHGGGFHSGGFHSGGFHSGGFHSGGFHSGGINHGGFNHGGFNHGGFHHGGGLWWYPRYYGNYGAWPYSSGYYPYSSGYSPYSYAADPYYSSDLGSGSTYDPGSSSSSYQSSSFYPAFPAQGDTIAHLTVSLPADAEIWFEGSKMTATGSVREFTSPPLTPGKRYTYDVRASWNEQGHKVTQKQEVEVSPGAHVRVEFPVPPRTAGQTPVEQKR